MANDQKAQIMAALESAAGSLETAFKLLQEVEAVGNPTRSATLHALSGANSAVTTAQIAGFRK